MAIIVRIDESSDSLNDVWETMQMAALLSAFIRGFEKGNQIFIESGSGAGGPVGSIITGYLGTLQLMYILMLVIPPANLSLACEDVLLELMDMQREASLDPKRTEEAVQISHIIGYYERCSPVS
jgi:hypothetical protein